MAMVADGSSINDSSVSAQEFVFKIVKNCINIKVNMKLTNQQFGILSPHHKCAPMNNRHVHVQHD